MRLELVCDGNDGYAIKRTRLFLFVSFYSFAGNGFWWGRGGQHYRNCWTTREEAEKWMQRMTV